MRIRPHTRIRNMSTARLVSSIAIFGIVVLLIIETRLRKYSIFHKLSLLNTEKANHVRELDVYNVYLNAASYSFKFEKTDLRRTFKISANGSEVILFLRVQKTGTMTLSRYLSDCINVTPWCMCSQSDKRCECYTMWKYILDVHSRSVTNNTLQILCKCSEGDNTCSCQQSAHHSHNTTLNPSQNSVINVQNKHLNVQKSSKRLTENSYNVNMQSKSSSSMNGIKHTINMKSWCNCSGSNQNCPCYKAWKNNVLFQGNEDNWPCGIHADWTYLHTCAEDMMNKRVGSNDNRKHLYITMVRDPYERYLSEWLFVNWSGHYFHDAYPCGGRRVTEHDVPLCPRFPKPKGLTLDDFMHCESNRAVNRQTRMLADLRTVHCYNHTGMSYDQKHYKILKSAKDNLRNMAFFGLTKHQELTQILFEHTFDVQFRVPFKTLPQKAGNEGSVSDVIRQKIIHMNRFDVMLFQYAKDLFRQRILLLIRETGNEHLRRQMQMLVQPLLK